MQFSDKRVLATPTTNKENVHLISYLVFQVTGKTEREVSQRERRRFIVLLDIVFDVAQQLVLFTGNRITSQPKKEYVLFTEFLIPLSYARML